MSIVFLEKRRGSVPRLSFQTSLLHVQTATLISFGLSLLYWVAFEIFSLAPYVFISVGCAIGGAAVGLIAGARLWVTALATAILRNGFFLVVLGPW